MLPIFSQENVGSIRFINFGFTMLSIFAHKILILFDLRFGGLRKGKMLPIFLKNILAQFDLSIWGSHGKMLSMFAHKILIFFDLRFGGFGKAKMLPIFLKKMLALFDLSILDSQCCPFFPQMFDLIRLALWGIKEGQNAANFFLSKVWLYSIYKFGVRNAVHFPQEVLFDLYFGGSGKGKMLPIFLKENLALFKLSDTGYTRVSIFAQNVLVFLREV